MQEESTITGEIDAVLRPQMLSAPPDAPVKRTRALPTVAKVKDTRKRSKARIKAAGKKIRISKVEMDAWALGTQLKEQARQAIGASTKVVAAAVATGTTVNGVPPLRAAELALSPGMLRVGGYADQAAPAAAVALVQLLMPAPGAASAQSIGIGSSIIELARAADGALAAAPASAYIREDAQAPALPAAEHPSK